MRARRSGLLRRHPHRGRRRQRHCRRLETGPPGDELVLAPQSDGGPGFVRVLSGRVGEIERSRVSGPLDAQVEAEWIFDANTRTAYIECAQACGLALLGGPPTIRTAVAAHSGGVGQLIDAALRSGATRIVVGLGGSGCTDGGRGMMSALGDFPRRRSGWRTWC